MQKISQRKYAQTIGVSHWAVGKAIRAGHIKKGFDKKSKKINEQVANIEWGNAAKERHSYQFNQVEQKEMVKQSPLLPLIVNYLNACDALMGAIDQELKWME